MSLKSPVIHPNDLPKAASLIHSKIPLEIDSVVSLFLTGGSIELLLSARGIDVRAYTHNRELLTFWACAAWDPLKIAKIAKEFRPLFEDAELFYQFQETRNDAKDPFTRSAIFFALNRSSENGIVSSGKYEKNCPRFNDLSISNLATFNFQKLIVGTTEDYIDIIDERSDTFLICCPYEKFTIRDQSMVPRAMELRRLQHSKLRKKIFNRKNWILLYELNNEVLDAYAGFHYELYDAAFSIVDSEEGAKYILIFANNL